VAQVGQFMIADVVAIALCEAEEEHCEIAGAVGDERPMAAASPLALSRDPLLDDAAAKIGVDKSALRPFDGLHQTGVGDAFAHRESGEQSGLENSHDTPFFEL